MSTSTIRYTANASVVLSSFLKNASFQINVAGGKGAGTYGGSGGKVNATIPAAASSTWTLRVGTAHYGGSGLNAGGASSALLNSSSVVLVEAGGGGGQGTASGGVNYRGGSGGTVATSGIGGNGANAGTGANGGTRGTGGTGPSGNGSNGVNAVTAIGSTSGGAGYTSHGGGGGGGYAGGGGGAYAATNNAGAAGGGGSSYIASSITTYSATTGTNATTPWIEVTQIIVDAPLAPTLVDPFDLEYINATASFTFKWDYNPDTDSGDYNAYCFRLKSTAAGSTYTYWNGSSFISTPTWMSDTTSQVVIPAGTFTAGITYNWSIATQEDLYNLQGPFATDGIFVASPGPSATITTPTAGSIISLGQPNIIYTANLDGTDTLTDYRIIIYNSSQIADPSFSVGSFASAWDSGTLSGGGVPNGTVITTPVTTVLSSNDTYYIYILMTETGGIQGQWSTSYFSVQYDEPSMPLISVSDYVDSATNLPFNLITTTATDNLLSYSDASFEDGVGTWTNVTNTTIAVSTAIASDGLQSLRMTANAAGTMSMRSSYYSCDSNTAYSAMISVRANTTSRNIRISLEWYDFAYNIITTVNSSLISDLTTSWSNVYLYATSPSNAVYYRIKVECQGCSSGERHYVDCVGMYKQSSRTIWSRGGLVGNSWMLIEYSDDLIDWLTVRGADSIIIPTDTKQVVVPDYESIPNTNRYYRCKVIGVS
jgi:hypothetical protein